MGAPLTDPVIFSVARLVDDAQSGTREPSHSDIESQIVRARLVQGDPRTHGQSVGKQKRVRSVLSWALENDPSAGEAFVEALIAMIRSFGGFRTTSMNYVGEAVIVDAIATFRSEGFELTLDGELHPLLLDTLKGVALSDALQSYIRRAMRGAKDAALVTGTGKDLLEATAAHILVERFGSYSTGANFPLLLGQAFTAIGMVTPQNPIQQGETAQRKVERAMYDLACSINTLRNKAGTGHGRPWPADVTELESKVAVEFMGAIAEWMLDAHKRNP